MRRHGMRIDRKFRRELKYGYATENARLHYFRESYVEVCDPAALFAAFRDGARQNCRPKIGRDNSYIRLPSFIPSGMPLFLFLDDK